MTVLKMLRNIKPEARSLQPKLLRCKKIQLLLPYPVSVPG
jgi:hypothetical protein